MTKYPIEAQIKAKRKREGRSSYTDEEILAIMDERRKNCSPQECVPVTRRFINRLRKPISQITFGEITKCPDTAERQVNVFLNEEYLGCIFAEAPNEPGEKSLWNPSCELNETCDDFYEPRLRDAKRIVLECEEQIIRLHRYKGTDKVRYQPLR